MEIYNRPRLVQLEDKFLQTLNGYGEGWRISRSRLKCPPPTPLPLPAVLLFTYVSEKGPVRLQSVEHRTDRDPAGGSREQMTRSHYMRTHCCESSFNMGRGVLVSQANRIYSMKILNTQDDQRVTGRGNSSCSEGWLASTAANREGESPSSLPGQVLHQASSTEHALFKTKSAF